MEKETKEEREDRIEQELLLANLTTVINTKPGRKIIWHILGLCGIYDSSFTGNSSTFYNEGKRDVGLDIHQLMEDADPLMYAKLLLAENTERLGENNG